MSTELMSRFLEGLHASRLLDQGRFEELLGRPEPPQGDLDGVVRFLESNGWLTRFQIDEIRDGRGTALTFMGYRLLERLPDQPSGPVFRAFHPALNQSVLLRWLNPEWVGPADNLQAYLERAKTGCTLTHFHAQGTLDAGYAEDRPFVVQEWIEGADLAGLVKEMGALPVPLASEYTRQTATAMQAAAERGIFHGDLAPARLLLTPIVRKPGVNGTGQTVSIRPAPGAAVKLVDLGLIPVRPPLGDIAPSDAAKLGEYSYAAPERLTRSVRDASADIWSLGACMYYLLTGRSPLPATSAVDAMQQLQSAEPVRIDRLRNDVPAPLADFLHRLLARDPAQRPASAAAVAEFLMPYCQFSPIPTAKPVKTAAVPLASETGTIPKAMRVVDDTEEMPLVEPLPHVEPLPEGTSDSQVFRPRASLEPLPDDHDAWSEQSGNLKPRAPKVKQHKSAATWIFLAILLHVIPITAAVLYFTDTWPFGRPVSSSTTGEESPPSDGPQNTKKLKNPSKL